MALKLKVLPKIVAKLGDISSKVEALFDKLEDNITDEDTQRVAKTVHKALSTLQKLTKLVPGLAAYGSAIKIAIMLCEALEDDGDLTKEDLLKLVLKKDTLIAAVKDLRNK
jgi:uncharacterized protein Yka (UPF0111/DUF47 family)